MSWGQHLILDLRQCDILLITDKTNIKKYVKNLCDRIHMKTYGNPLIKHFAAHDPAAAGYSLVQLIETSSITGHFVDISGNAYIDIFSCKEFDKKVAEDVTAFFFKPKKMKSFLLFRDAEEEHWTRG